MAASYTKLKSGEWGIRITESSVKAGDAVTVRKKDGTTKQETVQKVIWTGNGVTLCAIAQREYAGSSRNSGRSRKGWTGCSCGSIDGEPRASDCWQCQHDY